MKKLATGLMGYEEIMASRCFRTWHSLSESARKKYGHLSQEELKIK